MLIKTLEVSHTSIVYNLTKTCYKWASLHVETHYNPGHKLCDYYHYEHGAASATERMLATYQTTRLHIPAVCNITERVPQKSAILWSHYTKYQSQ